MTDKDTLPSIFKVNKVQMHDHTEGNEDQSKVRIEPLAEEGETPLAPTPLKDKKKKLDRAKKSEYEISINMAMLDQQQILRDLDDNF